MSDSSIVTDSGRSFTGIHWKLRLFGRTRGERCERCRREVRRVGDRTERAGAHEAEVRLLDDVVEIAREVRELEDEPGAEAGFVGFDVGAESTALLDAGQLAHKRRRRRAAGAKVSAGPTHRREATAKADPELWARRTRGGERPKGIGGPRRKKGELRNLARSSPGVYGRAGETFGLADA